LQGEAVLLASRIDEYARSQGLNANIQVIQYEGMRAGDEQFTRDVARRIPNITRVKTSRDIVPKLPPGDLECGMQETDKTCLVAPSIQLTVI
jgi:hypothetical protein